MSDKRWEFELDGVKHSVDLKHNLFSNKLSIYVDGKLETLSPETQKSKERNIKHAFRIASHACEAGVKTYKNGGVEYSFTIDGNSNIPEVSASKIVEVDNIKQAKQAKYQAKYERWIVFGLLLTFGIITNMVNWYFAHTNGMFNGLLVMFAPAFILFAFYYLFFPNEFSIQNANKISFRGWIFIILTLLLCFANLYAFEHGLY